MDRLRKMNWIGGYQDDLFHPDQNLEDARCAICFCIKAAPLILSCGHSFCGSCISAWTLTNKSCPICRKATQPDLADAKVGKETCLVIANATCICGYELKHSTTEQYKDHFVHDCLHGPRQVRHASVYCVSCLKDDPTLVPLECGHAYHEQCGNMNRSLQIPCFYCDVRKKGIQRRCKEALEKV